MKMIKKIYKYGTDDIVPLSAIYLDTVVQVVETQNDNITSVKQRYVWHYFLVEVEESNNQRKLKNGDYCNNSHCEFQIESPIKTALLRIC